VKLAAASRSTTCSGFSSASQGLKSARFRQGDVVELDQPAVQLRQDHSGLLERVDTRSVHTAQGSVMRPQSGTPPGGQPPVWYTQHRSAVEDRHIDRFSLDKIAEVRTLEHGQQS
jgi:hypothetical protein